MSEILSVSQFVRKTYSTRMHSWVLGLCTMLAFLLNLQLPRGVASNALDSSWAQVLAHALQNHIQWGDQLSFTYGPLGFITPYMGYVASIFWPYVFAQWIVATLFCILSWYALRSLPIYRLLFFAASLLTFGFWLGGDAAWLSAYALSIVALRQIVESRRKSFGLVVDVGLVAILPALLPLVKISLLVPWLIWLLAGATLCAMGKQRRVVWWFMVVALAFPLLGWLACGQDLAHSGGFLRSSLQVVAGYQDAMQLGAGAWVDVAGLLAVALMTIIATHYVLRQQDAKSVLVAMSVIAVVACAFKLGFTRADWVHLPIFSTTGLVVLSSFPPASRSQKAALVRGDLWMKVIWLACITLTVISGTLTLPGDLAARTLTGSLAREKATAFIEFVLNPHRVVASYKIKANEFFQVAELPLIRDKIGSDPVDILSYEQGIAYVNNFNLVFRPVFQSYSAYTASLMEKNDAFYRSSSAPMWLIMKFQTIDGRLPSEDDAQLFLRIFYNYVPRVYEKGYLLLRREPSSMACTPRSLGALELPIGTWLNLSDRDHVIKIRVSVKLSWAGKFKALIVRSPIAAIEVRSDDGRIKRYRLLRAVAEKGFVISPLLDDTRDYLKWRQGEKVRRAASLRIVPWEDDEYHYFLNEVQVSMDALNCHP
jgi:hypothetical protein